MNEPPCEIGVNSHQIALIYIQTYERYHILKYVRLKVTLGDTKKVVLTDMKKGEMCVNGNLLIDYIS